MLGGVHGRIERSEVADAEGAVADQRPEFQLELGRIGESALGADQQMCHVDAVRPGVEGVEIVPADAALHLREACSDFIGFASADGQEVVKQCALGSARGDVAQVIGDAAKMHVLAGRKGRIDAVHVVAHRAIAQRSPAAGVVAGHAADRRARRRRDIDRKPQSMRLQLPVEIVEHDPRFDDAAFADNIEFEHAGEMFRAVDNDAGVNGLAALRGSATTCGHRHGFSTRDLQRGQCCFRGAGDDDGGRHDLIGGGVGGVASAAHDVGQDFSAIGSAKRLPQAPFQVWQCCRRHLVPRLVSRLIVRRVGGFVWFACLPPPVIRTVCSIGPSRT